MILEGDCLNRMQAIQRGAVDLIYADPPYGTEKVRKGKAGKFDDRFGGLENYLAWMRPRLRAMWDVLSENGSLYLHVDPSVSHYLKIELDHIFGRKAFRNEIAWCYAGPSVSNRDFPRKHDTILRYAAGKEWTFNADAARMPCKTLNLGGHGPTGKGITQEMREKYLLRGKLCEDWWEGIYPVQRTNSEGTGYPTQKPIKLLERIIGASSNAGDMVLDPFCGSGTTLVAAKRLGRKYIGIERNPDAIEIARKRLSDEDSLFDLDVDSDAGSC